MKTANLVLSWMRETVESYQAQLSLSKSKRTVDAYCTDVVNMLEFLQEKGFKRAISLKADHVVRYLSKCKEEGKADSTINRYYMSISSFVGYLRQRKIIKDDIMQDIEMPKSRLKAPYIPTLEQIDKLMSMPDTSREIGVRDRAMLELLYSSGLRASELCNLELCDIGQDQVMVRCGKREKTRTVPMTESAVYWVNKYLDDYRTREGDALFLTTYDKPMRRNLLSEIVSAYGKKAGIKEITTHTLRHSCATHLLNEGADIRMIQEILGHSSISSTQRYTHLSSNKMQFMFKKFHPRKMGNDTVSEN